MRKDGWAEDARVRFPPQVSEGSIWFAFLGRGSCGGARKERVLGSRGGPREESSTFPCAVSLHSPSIMEEIAGLIYKQAREGPVGFSCGARPLGSSTGCGASPFLVHDHDDDDDALREDCGGGQGCCDA